MLSSACCVLMLLALFLGTKNLGGEVNCTNGVLCARRECDGCCEFWQSASSTAQHLSPLEERTNGQVSLMSQGDSEIMELAALWTRRRNFPKLENLTIDPWSSNVQVRCAAGRMTIRWQGWCCGKLGFRVANLSIAGTSCHLKVGLGTVMAEIKGAIFYSVFTLKIIILYNLWVQLWLHLAIFGRSNFLLRRKFSVLWDHMYLSGSYSTYSMLRIVCYRWLICRPNANFHCTYFIISSSISISISSISSSSSSNVAKMWCLSYVIWKPVTNKIERIRLPCI